LNELSVHPRVTHRERERPARGLQKGLFFFSPKCPKMTQKRPKKRIALSADEPSASPVNIASETLMSLMNIASETLTLLTAPITHKT